MKNRSVIEIMVLVFVFIVAFTLVGLGVIILVVEVKHPEADTALLINTMMSLVSGILGALLGLIAGKATILGSTEDLGKVPEAGDTEVSLDP
jgi:hypothetical protein